MMLEDKEQSISIGIIGNEVVIDFKKEMVMIGLTVTQAVIFAQIIINKVNQITAMENSNGECSYH